MDKTPEQIIAETLQRMNEEDTKPVVEPKVKKKPKVHVNNPYSFNSVSLRRPAELSLPDPSDMIANPTYNGVAKFLGVDTVKDWGLDYDKVYTIVQWAKMASKKNDTEGIVTWIDKAKRYIPSLMSKEADGNLSRKRLEEIYLYAKSKLR